MVLFCFNDNNNNNNNTNTNNNNNNIWKRILVSHPWYCPYLVKSLIAAETWLRIPRKKKTGEDHTLIII